MRDLNLNDLEWLFCVKFCFRASLAGSDYAIFEKNCVKTGKNRHSVSGANLSQGIQGWQYKVSPDIRSGFLERS